MFWTLVIVFSFIVFTIFSISVFIGVPPLPTHLEQAKKMIELSGLEEGMKAVDLGSGTGRLLFLALKTGAQVEGYELNPFLFFWTRFVIYFKGWDTMAEAHFQSIYNAKVGEADVVFAFLFPGPMKKLVPKLFSEMKPGAKIVSYAFPFPELKPVHEEQGIYVYEVKKKD